MANTATANARVFAQTRSGPNATLCLLAGWLVPGAGHFLLRKPVRGLLLLVSIVAMFSIGLALQGELYQPNSGSLLDILNFVGQLGAGLLYVFARVLDLGHPSMQVALSDYGTKFMVVAGLLNVVSAVDAHSLASGRKAL